MLTKEEIEKISDLARISLTEKEKEKFAHELSTVLDYFQQLQKLDTSAIDLSLTETETTNQTREDVQLQSEIWEKILSQAPATMDNFIKVKSVF